MKLRFLIAGLGSMGKRRIRNLHAAGERDIVGFDVRQDRQAEAEEKYNIRTVSDFKDATPDSFDVLIISASPEAHGDYIRFALKHNKHFFVEHPVFDDGYDDIFRSRGSITVKVPSCTMLFYTPIIMMKKILDQGRIGKILAFQYHMGQYLPDWHPWEDYRKVYFSKKETGACREMFAFELIWLNWLMSSHVSDISGSAEKVSDLDMDADDLFTASAKYENGIRGHITIDVISRKPFRTLRILGSKGVLDWERFDSEIRVYDAASNKTNIIPVPKGHPEKGYVNEEEMYNEEIKTFIDSIRNNAEYPHTFEENHQLLKTLFALEKSSAIGERITV